MPEAALNFDDAFQSGEDDVWFSWKVFAVESKPKSQRMNQSTYNHLGFRPDTPNPAHVLATPKA
jgi:hypothetical protein